MVQFFQMEYKVDLFKIVAGRTIFNIIAIWVNIFEVAIRNIKLNLSCVSIAIIICLYTVSVVTITWKQIWNIYKRKQIYRQISTKNTRKKYIITS